MITTTSKDQITDYITKNFKAAEPIIQKELYRIFDAINPITIRQTLIRLSQQGRITKSRSIPGVYFIPKQNTILKSQSLDFNQLIEKKFMKDQTKNNIGYESGFSIANQLGLTTQTSSKVIIYSNAVGKRKREITIDNRRYIVNKPRIDVDNRNYKFLQVLDLISDFETYCEVEPDKALRNIKKYLSDLTLTKSDIELIIASYPMKTERNYYKLGVNNVITQGFRSLQGNRR